ncbi:MAG: glycosyltransferase family 39 protein [Ardenticatenaceae bacterium]|nr:glycosyltransferase family 39 protein [Anaerolineales bacterium]MCB8923767.1 glycosyltransferase family 39 protein [Ardenticatenaceae bacterium]MCB8990102.1 glycosyltransferase family 39 protein [Ardenticatenaceae bacterium]
MKQLQRLGANPRRTLMMILLVSVLLRVAVALYMGNQVVPLPGVSDQESYHNLALRLLGGHGFSFGENWWPVTQADAPTAHWSFLYTLYVTAVYAIFGPVPVVARLIQAVAVGLLMPWLVFRLAQKLFAQQGEPGTVIGLVAAGVTAVYIYFFYYAGALMTESFYITAILWVFDIALSLKRGEKRDWSRWILLGVALGVTVLLRQLFLLFIPFLLLWLWWATRPNLLKLALPLVITVLFILPWTYRNYRVFDQFVLLNTNSGYAFYWGNHPIYGTHFIPILPPEMGSYIDLLPKDLLRQNMSEAALDSALLGRALENIQADPLRYIQLSISRIPPYFAFWPEADSGMVSNLSRLGSFALFLPFMLAGLVMTLRYRYGSWQTWLASPFTLIYLFVVIYTGIHVLTWTLVRYRLPIDAFLVIFAALAICRLGEWLLKRK